MTNVMDMKLADDRDIAAAAKVIIGALADFDNPVDAAAVLAAAHIALIKTLFPTPDLRDKALHWLAIHDQIVSEAIESNHDRAH